MFRVVIWVESFRCAGILLLQLQGEYVAHRQHLKFCHIQLLHCGSKNPTPPKVFNRFSKSSPELEDVEGGYLGGKFQVRRYFTFAMARRKLCASTTFEILPLSTCTLWQQKSYISKGIQTIFEIFAWARRCLGWWFGWKGSAAEVFYFCNGKVKICTSSTFEILPISTCTPCQEKSYTSKSIQPIFEMFTWAPRCWGWAFGSKVSGAQVFYFCNGKVKTLGIDNIWNFATFNLLNGPAKIPYLQKYSTDIRNLCLRSKMLTVGIWVESFRCAGILLLQWKGENFEHRQHLNFCRFQPVHCTLWLEKSYISKSIQPIFEIFASARRCWGWAFGWKVLRARVVYFCNGNVKTLGIENIWIFATFDLFTVPAKIPYLQRYSIDFRNLCLSSKIVRVGIWVESFRCAGILLLQWQGENFGHRKHFNFCHFQHVHCASKNHLSPKLFNRFSKSLPQHQKV